MKKNIYLFLLIVYLLLLYLLYDGYIVWVGCFFPIMFYLTRDRNNKRNEEQKILFRIGIVYYLIAMVFTIIPYHIYGYGEQYDSVTNILYIILLVSMIVTGFTLDVQKKKKERWYV